jgi:hypothetical protein
MRAFFYLSLDVDKVKDYYLILGVSKEASTADIILAFRKLAKRYHPDVSIEGNSIPKFLEIYEAYEILKDEQSRLAYDRIFLESGKLSSNENSIYSLYHKSQEEARRKAEYYASHPFAELKDQLKRVAKEAGSIGGGVFFMTSALGIIMMIAFIGLLIIILPLLVCLLFPFIPWVGARVALFIACAVPYWIWLYTFLTRKN